MSRIAYTPPVGPILGLNRTVMALSGRLAGGTTAATRLFAYNASPVSTSGTTTVVAIWNLAASEWAVSGFTAKLRVVVELQTNATAPTVSFTIGLYPVTVAGGANVMVYTPGTVVTGSTIAFTTPGASAITNGNSGAFALPADGAYCLGVVNDGTTAANSEVHIVPRLEIANL